MLNGLAIGIVVALFAPCESLSYPPARPITAMATRNSEPCFRLRTGRVFAAWLGLAEELFEIRPDRSRNGCEADSPIARNHRQGCNPFTRAYGCEPPARLAGLD